MQMRLTATRPENGFTIVEVMVVVAALLLLGGVLLSSLDGLLSTKERDQAVAELAIIQLALEEYKVQFGSYPRKLTAYDNPPADTEEHLLNALCGKLDPSGVAINVEPLLNLSPLRLQTSNYPNHAAKVPVSNRIMDPWGNPYVYRFDPKNGTWENYSYVLFSMGPDEEFATDDVKGDPLENAVKNLDNVYAK